MKLNMRELLDGDPRDNISRLADKSTGCWILPGSKDNRTYRVFRIGLKQIAAHRFVYSLWMGPLIPGMVIMHKCDNPACLNPEHLRQGAYRENTQDCIAKGRFGYINARIARGEL